MANRLTDEKVNAIAQEYCTNGLIKSVALITVGYSENYATHNGLKLFDNDRVKTAIAKIQAKAAEKAGYSIEQAQNEYEQARLLAMKMNQPAAAATAITGKARLHGYDKDAGTKDTVAVVNVVNYAGSAGVKPPAKPVESITKDKDKCRQ